MKNKIIAIFLTYIFLSACTTTPLKAPCNENAAFCGTKIKINQW